MQRVRLPAFLLATIIIAACQRVVEPVSCSLAPVVAVLPVDATLQVGDALTLSASLRAGCTGQALKTDGWWWSSSNARVVATDPTTGVILARDTGRTVVTARALPAGVEGTSAILVAPLPPCFGPGGAATPVYDTLAVGDSVRYRLPAEFMAHVPPRIIRWSSSDTLVAIISADSGLARARSMGVAQIRGSDRNSPPNCPGEWLAWLVVR
jgi:uncharacterized protein YjdB